MVKKIALLTAGGYAPCLSASLGFLIKRWTEVSPQTEIIAYRHGYLGLLTGDSIPVTDSVRDRADVLTRFGGSPIGNSRVKLTNTADLVKRGLITEGDDPLRVAADRLIADGIDVLHTIGGDDTNTTAADLARYLNSQEGPNRKGNQLTVVGLPKTIDNDVVPIKQTLGAWTAAEMGARFARNVMAEHNVGPRMLIIHEVMGRNCGWLTAATARAYRDWLDQSEWLPEFGLAKESWDVNAVWIPESSIDLEAEVDRLRAIMDEQGSVSVFLSEGAGLAAIVAELEAAGAEVPRDPFGHVRLDDINPGAWFAKQLKERLGAEKVLVQKSGYYARAAAANAADLELISRMCDRAVVAAQAGEAGVIGEDYQRGDELRAIEFDRIAGGKPFDPTTDWYRQMLAAIGQTQNA